MRTALLLQGVFQSKLWKQKKSDVRKKWGGLKGSDFGGIFTIYFIKFFLADILPGLLEGSPSNPTVSSKNLPLFGL